MPLAVELCVGAVVVEEGRLLLIRRGRPPGAGLWSVPGGRVEPGETLAEAVVRELAEETGQEGMVDGLLGWVERIDDTHHFVILDFTVTVLDPQPLRPGDDAADVAWVPLPDVTDLPLVDGLAEFLHAEGILDVLA